MRKKESDASRRVARPLGRLTRRGKLAAASTPGQGARYYYKGNRTKQLRAFVAIAKLGSLARAAESLFLSAPSVSLQLSALEQELGELLVLRGRHGVRLTRAGEVLLEQAQALIEALDSMPARFHGKLAGLGAGELTIAAGASTIRYLLPPLVAGYREQFPSVRLHLANVTGKDGLALLRSDEADFAVGSMLDVPHDLAYQPFWHYDPMLIVPIGHPLARKRDLALADVSPYGLILPPHRLTTYRLVDLVFQRRGVPYSVAIEVGGWEVIKQYVAMGLGVSIVTSICLTQEDAPRLVARNMSAWFPKRSYGVVMRKGKYLSPEARGFVELINPALSAYHDDVVETSSP